VEYVLGLTAVGSYVLGLWTFRKVEGYLPKAWRVTKET
jgi:hypothetical protein